MSPASAVAELAGRDLGTRTVRYAEDDAILYALAVGARAEQLELVYERELRVLPTYGLALGLWVVDAASALGLYDPARTLHVGQRLAVWEPLPRAGALETGGRIAGVWDKGSAALVEVVVECAAFEASYTIFVKDGGGWGGDRGGSSSPPAPAGPPDLDVRAATTPDQAVLYRLTGDRHPLHVDPAAAREAGFDGPILHGLCTLGVAALATAAATGAAPWRLRELSARFAAPVYPGAVLDLGVWIGGEAAAFDARVDGAPVLTSGLARFDRETR